MATIPPRSSESLESRLAPYGVSNIIRLDERLTSAEQLEYLDLLPKQSNHAPALTAVAEHQGAALLYLVDAGGDIRSDTASLATLRKQLANRSDPAWLGVLRPGFLEVFPIGFQDTVDSRPVKIIEEQSATAPLFFQSLVHGTFEENHRLTGADYVFNKIFDLLTRMTTEFVPVEGKGKLDALEVLSMAGRALFFRFLIDRRIVLDSEVDQICPVASELKDVFSSADKAAQTSAWLDATFNGDFLPLVDESIPANNREARAAEYQRFFRRTERLAGKRVFVHLDAILRGWRATGDAVQTELDWGDLDFAHIPVGVLSQVYESFSHRADPRTARDTSVHYTPRLIAGLMVEQAFAATKDKTSTRVLDGSCGAGIFLVLAFRHLVREHWIAHNQRPKTAVIQSILYNQLVGFDISEPALRLAALALYITAIELNASPRPPQALKFPRNLRGAVLYRLGVNESEAMTFPLGSLGPEVPQHFDDGFDIVIGNPPWTRLRDSNDDLDGGNDESVGSPTDELNRTFTEIGRRVLARRGLKDLAAGYTNPDKNPDLPFLWRAMEWAKEGAVIALAMPARLFGRTSGRGLEAWRAVLRSVEVTGLINGADLRWSAVWQEVKIPFCLFFARNRVPGPDHRFFYAAPVNEPELNGSGRFRIDYEAAQPISAARVEKQPWILKTLAFGTWLDVELIEALSTPDRQTLKSFWADWDPGGERTGQGYNRSPNSHQKVVDFLADLPVFTATAQTLLGATPPKTYAELYGRDSSGQSSAHKPRRRELFQAPLVIIPQSPGDDARRPRAYILNQPVAFSQSYYGYSCTGHPEADALAGFICLLAHSTLFDYFCLMTSRRSGFDRQTFNKEEFDALPFPDVASLSGKEKTAIRSLVQRLHVDRVEPRADLNEFIFRLYGLNAAAIQVAQDTLFSAAAYRKAGKAALERTIDGTRKPFLDTLRSELEPYFEVCAEHAAVREATFEPADWREPWFFFSVSREGHSVPVNPALMRKAMEVANQRGCSRITIHAPGRRGLLVGLLNQRRWWTITRARLCAQHIIRERLGSCGLPERS